MRPLISVTELRQHTSSDLPDTELERILQMALTDILRYEPNAPDDNFRDGQLVELVKLFLAYDGVAAITLPGYSARWEDRRAEIASRRAPLVWS